MVATNLALNYPNLFALQIIPPVRDVKKMKPQGKLSQLKVAAIPDLSSIRETYGFWKSLKNYDEKDGKCFILPPPVFLQLCRAL